MGGGTGGRQDMDSQGGYERWMDGSQSILSLWRAEDVVSLSPITATISECETFGLLSPDLSLARVYV